MSELKPRNGEKTERHLCHSRQEGDWIIYTCPDCDYELRDNWRTGEMTVANAKADVDHSGSHYPSEYLGSPELLN